MCFTKLLPNKKDKLHQNITEFCFDNDWNVNCDYLEEYELREVQIGQGDLSVIHLNVRGLIGKQDMLLKFLNRCNKTKIDVITLSETWLTCLSQDKINIGGYHLISSPRLNKKGGGVGILINKELKYKDHTDIKVDNQVFENCTVEIKASNRNILIGSVYRPPNTNQKEFLRCWNTYIEQLKGKHDIMIGSDHNMDLLKSESNHGTQQFLDLLMDKEICPLITKLTRITKLSATLIDNLFVSRSLYSKSLNGIIINDMSDHLPCIFVLPNAIP